jgi:hypothetical protein
MARFIVRYLIPFKKEDALGVFYSEQEAKQSINQHYLESRQTSKTYEDEVYYQHHLDWSHTADFIDAQGKIGMNWYHYRITNLIQTLP